MKLILGDSNIELKNIPDESVDALITDPPYGTNDNYGKSIKRGNFHTDFNVIKWDTALPLEYLSECYRIMKNDTWGVVFTDKKEITNVWNYLESIGFSPRNTFYWIKPNKAPTMRKNFKSSVETAIIFTKGRTNIKWRGNGNQNNYEILPFVLGKESVNHPTQKPIKLMNRFVELFTDVGDVIIDPFMGSGTTGISCVRNGRDFIGIELNTEYFELSKKRIYNEIDIYNKNVHQLNTSNKFFGK